MATNNITFSSLVSQLVKIFKSSEMLEDYQNEYEQFECYGWTGNSMSPISRPSFVQKFGEVILLQAEKKAREQMEEEKTEFEKGEYFAAAAAADELRDKGEFGKLGGYVWAFHDGLKGEGGIPGAIRNMVYSSTEYIRPYLCKIERVEKVNDSFFTDLEAADLLVQRIGGDSFPGGGESFRTPEGDRYITNVCLCVSESGKSCYIDCEGYDWARYILFPVNYLNIFADEFAAEKAKADRLE